MLFLYVILALMLATDLLWWRYADGLLRPLRRARLWRTLVGVFACVQILLLFWTLFARVVGPGFDQLTPKSLIAATYLWHLIALPVLLLLWIFTGVVAMPVRLAKWIGRMRKQQPRHAVSPAEAAAVATDMALEPETAVAPSRRQMLGAAFAAAPVVLTAGGLVLSSRSLDHFRVRSINLAIPNLPSDLDGLRIAQVTDVHVGRFTEGPQLRKIVEATNALRADLVVMTGDLLNNAISDLPASLHAVKKIDAKHGVYLIEGNHDLFEGRAAFARGVRNAGVELLVNENRVLNVRGVPLQLLGLRWGAGLAARSGGGDESLKISMPDLLKQRRPDAFPILLAHHPHAFDPAAAAGIPLTLSGHTHGGQIMLNPHTGFGPLMFRYWSGLYTRGASSLVVSNGVGNWFPLRINAPAEIVQITLRKA